MVTIRFSILRVALLGALLALCALSPAQADPTHPANRVFPAYPADVAGCNALKAGGPFKVAFDTDNLRTLVSGGDGTRFMAFIVPETPLFRFYFYAHNDVAFFEAANENFPPSLQCFIRAVNGPDTLGFANLPPGQYIVLERTDEPVTYVGDEEGWTSEPGPGGELEHYHTHTPVWKHYVRSALVGVNLTISANGSVSASGTNVLYFGEH